VVRALLIAILLLAPCAARAETRVALLIGEGAYVVPPPTVHGWFWPKLVNPAHDVGLVAQNLTADGFDVTLAVDLDRTQLETAIAAFAVKAARSDDAVVYYAGHGFEYARHNYIVPVGSPVVVDVNHLGDVFIDLDDVAAAASKARHVNIFFLDACRTPDEQVQLIGAAKPYVDDVEFQPGAQVAVVYSAARGEKAFDHGVSTPPPIEYSPFAWYVAHYVTLPRTSLSDFFTFVNAEVQKSTRTLGPQSPYMLSSLTQAYYFRPAGALAPRPPPIAGDGQPGPVPVGVAQGRGLAASPDGAAPLDLSLGYLAVTDEPVVVADVLADHTPDDIAALAEGGDPMAAYLLGYMFEFGRGAQQDLVQARTWLERAAASNIAPAQLELGYFLLKNGASDDDRRRGRALIEAAAAQGFAKAEAHLAGDVLMPDGVRADYDRGVDLYRAAARQNYPQALYALATLNDAGAKGKLALLAAGGDMASRQWMCELAAANDAVAYALPECTAAAQAGYAISQARLAIVYHDGQDVPADPDEARHWTRLALEQPDLRPDLQAKLRAFGY
jgi:TPR repeat protein